MNETRNYIKEWKSEKFDSVSKKLTASESSELNKSGYSLKFYSDRGNMIGVIKSIEPLHWVEAFNETVEYWGNTGTIPFTEPSFMHEENAVRYLFQRID